MIYKGTWRDGLDVEFSRTAHHLTVYATGGVAANTRVNRKPTAPKHTFVSAARALAEAWNHELTEEQKDAWDARGGTAYNRDNEGWDPDGLGWRCFNALNFHLMYYSAQKALWPYPGVGGARITQHVITAHVDTQHLEYDFDYNAEWALQTNAYVSIYQINPRNSAGEPGPHNTRFCCEEYTWTPGGGHKNGSALAPFPFTAQPPAHTLWRVANGSVFTDNRVIETS